MISDAKMLEIADKVRPLVQPIIDRDRALSYKTLKLACKNVGHQIVSERTLSRIMEHICAN